MTAQGPYTGETVLHVRHLGLRLGPRFAVVIEALDLNRGERLVLDAVSGAGKSTALGLISGALAPSVFPDRRHDILGRTVSIDLPRAQFAGPDAVGFVLQTNTLVPYLDVAANIALPMRIAGLAPEMDWRARLISLLGLERLLDRRPSALSVGQRQRVSVARALLGRPALLLLDEPVASLDPGNVEKVERLISHLADEAGSGVLLASHQAQTGAFAGARRLPHRLQEVDGVIYSVFGTSGSAMSEVA